MAITITKIERQKKNNQRYSLFSNDKFIVGVSEETLLEFNIASGSQLSEESLDKIKQKETYVEIREQAWRFLARRMHSEKELEIKLINKGFEKSNIEKLIEELRGKKYLNDEIFARQLIADEIELKKSGPILIKNKLLKKGVEMSLVGSLLDDSYPEELQYTNCEYHARKKLKSLTKKDESVIKNRLATYLTQKGFSWEIINTIILDIQDRS
jgi:regulatory protein